ncbi:hypothetical protein HSX11_10915 [Oxalobacteraceae bacterium]|nr:hypothetical protein [Oxalobacteraceae bacterium]
MIVMRESQIDHLDAAWRRSYIDRLCSSLREQFADELDMLDQATLHERVRTVLLRAASYGIDAERDVCRFLNLAVFYGWDIGLSDATAWMHRILSDPDITTPSARLHCLVNQCIYRADVAETNSRLDQDFRSLSED